MLGLLLMMLVAAAEPFEAQPKQIETVGTKYACLLPEVVPVTNTPEAMSQAWQASLILAQKRAAFAKTPEEIIATKAALEQIKYCANPINANSAKTSNEPKATS